MLNDSNSTGSVRELEHLWIPLSDGCRLSARVWLPGAAAGGVRAAPAPAILEYLPYRKDDVTADHDATRHPYFAAHGFASVRVDLRGTGDSDGVLLGEYLKQEQDDAIEVIAWIARQPWCTGSVGMIGYSWGGFNGLQIAARRPSELKAVVSAYSTDDRYRDDCHYAGGCLLASDMLKWATTMRAYNALPPDPRIRRDWRKVWQQRLEQTPAFVADWLSHQTRDAFWRQGSVAEDYSAIQAATLIVGGWADAYTNAVPRLLEHLTCERKGIIGPWAHAMPYVPAVPGPQIDFLHECVRWFSRWLAEEPTGVEDDPLLRVWIGDRIVSADTPPVSDGAWLAEDEWPPSGAAVQSLVLDEGGVLSAAARPEGSSGAVAVRTPQHVGRGAGTWCPNGRAGELPSDQRVDDELSVVFDSELLAASLTVLGVPTVHLAVSSDRPEALVAARLSEVSADGASTLVSWGLLNLTHRNGDRAPELLEPGRSYDVAVRLNALGHRFSAGSRIRLALSTTYWPHAWPSPAPAVLVVGLGGRSTMELPVMERLGPTTQPFGPADDAHRGAAADASSWTRRESHDPERGAHLIAECEEGRTLVASTSTTLVRVSEDDYRIAEDDPLSATTQSSREWALEREGWRIRVVADATMTCDAGSFFVEDSVEAWQDDVPFYAAKHTYTIARNGV